MIHLKMELLIIMKKYAVDLAIKFPQDRFYRQWYSQRPPASVRVNQRFPFIIFYLSLVSQDGFYDTIFRSFNSVFHFHGNHGHKKVTLFNFGSRGDHHLSNRSRHRRYSIISPSCAASGRYVFWYRKVEMNGPIIGKQVKSEIQIFDLYI